MSTSKGLKKFCTRMFLFLTPFFILLFSFVIIDPFRVIKKYDHYNGAMAVLNPDVISTEMYLKKRGQMHYNSFIFGNSKTLAYRTSEWEKYLGPEAVPFVYHASFESLYGIAAKVKFIDKLRDTIKNALFILDETILIQTKNSDSHLTIKDPRTTGESRLQFYNSFFKAYLSDFFFIKCIDYSIFKKKRDYLKNVIDNEDTFYDPVSNDLYPADRVKNRKNDSAAFYKQFRSRFPSLTLELKTDPKPILDSVQDKMLNEIKQVLKKHGTKYKIIIGPRYNCFVLHPADTKKLKEIFGAENVYDFSGVNKFTADIHNFYEPFHYTIETGKNILEEVYSSENKKSDISE